MPPKLYKVAEVCELAQLQPYVLRSWEKEFPGIGLQKAGDSQRLYRQSDVDQVLRIKQLVFGEGLTLSGVRRRVEAATQTASPSDDAADVFEVLGADARKRIGHVREGLRSLLQLLNGGSHEAPMPQPAAVPTAVRGRASALRGKPATRTAKVVTRGKPAARGTAAAKRKRATA